MAIKKKNGEYFKTRNSNHKYKELDDLDNIKKLRKQYSRAIVAEMFKVPPNSLRFREVNNFTEEELSEFVYDRERHQNRRISQ